MRIFDDVTFGCAIAMSIWWTQPVLKCIINTSTKGELIMKFEEKLIQLRKSKGISQEELADNLGVSRQAISRWELGQTMPDAPNLVKLGELFNVSIDYLLHDDYENKATNPFPNTTESEEKQTSLHKPKAHLFSAIIWIIAAFCFLIAAILSQNDMARTCFIICVILDFLNAGINFYYFNK